VNPLARQLLNTLKCPLCGGLIDILEWKQALANAVKFNFCCVNDWEHYHLFLQYWDNPIEIQYERVCIYDGACQFDVLQTNATNQTDIHFYTIDPEKRILAKSHEPLIYSLKLFDFQHTNQEIILNKIRTILTFQ
jgi:hypothetical protein